MLTKIQKWGHSLGLRIPKSQADELGIEAGAPVDVSVRRGELVVRAVRPRRYDLKALLGKITPANRHDETDWGEPLGRESL